MNPNIARAVLLSIALFIGYATADWLPNLADWESVFCYLGCVAVLNAQMGPRESPLIACAFVGVQSIAFYLTPATTSPLGETGRHAIGLGLLAAGLAGYLLRIAATRYFAWESSMKNSA